MTKKAVKSPPLQGGLTFIEQLQIFTKNPCSKKNVPYLIGVNENAKSAILTKTTCKMWNCEACGARNAANWIARIINGCNKLGGEWFFLTITANPKKRKLLSVANLRDGWKKLYNRILAKQGKKATDFFYCKVWEQHKDGTFHLHILSNFYVSTKWLKTNANQCGLGYQAKTIKVDNAGQIAGYIAKYTLKNASIARNNIAWPKGLRRIEVSRNWPEFDKAYKIEGVDWIVKFTREEQIESANRWHLRGFNILDMVKEVDNAAIPVV